MAIVETRCGRTSGINNRGIWTFKGIPYARPPVGPLRFRPPQPPEPWRGVLKAHRPGCVPIQASLPWMKFLNAGASTQSEDCLYLNVFTPGLDNAKRPVLVWVHGGGFLIGAGSTPIYNGGPLARRGDIVVVTLNYRLGALGFLHLNGIGGPRFENASNAGVRDQIAALEWVRDNIQQFGGDPDNVTVCGQSAGAMSIGGLIGAPRARRLFHRAIFQSGAAHHVIDQAEADRIATRFLEHLDIEPRELERIADVPVSKILKAQGATNRAMADLINLMVLLPCVDGDVIPRAPLEAVREGEVAHIPFMVGTTLDEWKLFTPIDSLLPSLGEEQLIERFEGTLARVAANPPDARVAARRYREAVRARGGATTPFEVWSAFQSGRVFHHPASLLAEQQAAAGGEVYTYLFSWKPAALNRTLGACHAIELPFVFGLTGHPAARPLTGFASTATRLSTRMQHAWIEFARSGRPIHSRLPEWERYEPVHRTTMLFDRECGVADAPLEGERELFSSWL